MRQEQGLGHVRESIVVTTKCQFPTHAHQGRLVMRRDQPLEETRRQPSFGTDPWGRRGVSRTFSSTLPASDRCRVEQTRSWNTHRGPLTSRSNCNLRTSWSEREGTPQLAQVKGYTRRNLDSSPETKAHDSVRSTHTYLPGSNICSPSHR